MIRFVPCKYIVVFPFCTSEENHYIYYNIVGNLFDDNHNFYYLVAEVDNKYFLIDPVFKLRCSHTLNSKGKLVEVEPQKSVDKLIKAIDFKWLTPAVKNQIDKIYSENVLSDKYPQTMPNVHSHINTANLCLSMHI